MDLNNINRIGSLFGTGLNAEEISGLEVAVLQRKLEENLSGKMLFWGKIFGSTQDYLIICNLNTFADFPEKKYYFCTTSNYMLKAFPTLKPEYEDIASKISIAFTGDASFFAYSGEEPEPDDPEAPPVERFREIHRLVYTVNNIDNDCAIVPRGSYLIDATKKVIQNAYFQGLSFHTSMEARAYMHFRLPQSQQGIALLKKPGIIKSGDFMDCIDKDMPQGIWSVSLNDSGTVSSVRSHYWEGYGFYSIINSSEYGGVYFGIGVPNYDVAFML